MASTAGVEGSPGRSSRAVGGRVGEWAGPGDSSTLGTGAATKAVTKDEDEWKEFEQKEVDYSGLQVQAMQISEKEEDDNERRSR